MKTIRLLICAAGAPLLVSCQSLPLLSGNSAAANPYSDEPNGGYSTGDFYGSGANPYSTPMDTGASYASSYHQGPETYDSVSVIPFTDNGSDAVEPADPPPPKVASRPEVAAPRKSSPKVAANARSTSGSRTGKVIKAVYRPESKKKTVAKSSTPKTYVVKRGDTLTKISRAHGTSVAVLKKKNSLDSDLIMVGQELVVK